ncbi:hypothetical protein [Algibacter sp. L4_22]|uniref:hypothetical protein n=1 Tax=Algibacter sp. L4_22 TaxID=2942477 RepID=UPI00201B727D|nr:hypothetical protein [Algibacter sp. L4_22]MCL5130543.1 hypothetical protein [Algibacter sp. L4_22]
MKKIILILTCIFCLHGYSQSKKRDTIYFFINKNDSLIYKQVATKMNPYEGYVITDEKRIVKKIKRSSDIAGDDIEYDTFSDYSFSFNRKNDIIISKSHLNTLNYVKDRRQFIYEINDPTKTWIEYIFIEPTKCSKFILRKVRSLKFE